MNQPQPGSIQQRVLSRFLAELAIAGPEGAELSEALGRLGEEGQLGDERELVALYESAPGPHA